MHLIPTVRCQQIGTTQYLSILRIKNILTSDQAYFYAINRDKIIDMAYFGMAEPMKVVFAAQRPGALDPKEFPYDYNIEKAKKLMVKAGYADGFKVVDLPICQF